MSFPLSLGLFLSCFLLPGLIGSADIDLFPMMASTESDPGVIQIGSIVDDRVFCNS